MSNLKFVWPKDGPKGRSGHRGFWGRLNNIVTNRGPDVFIQRKNDRRGINPEWWGNWDSYHDLGCHNAEQAEPYYSRGLKRYDPETRRYVRWAHSDNWFGQQFEADPNGGPLPIALYPRFTEKEWQKICRLARKGRFPIPRKMGSDWNQTGPERFQQRHDWFWQEAHRLGENKREGFPDNFPANPFFQMHQQLPRDLYTWYIDGP